MPFIKTVLITGAARRVGAAIVQACVAANYQVILHYHTSVREAEALIARCEQEKPGSIVLSIQADLRDVAKCSEIAAQIKQKVGRLDVLINNASRFYPTPFGQVTEASWTDLMDSNAKAAFFLSQACKDLLLENNGCIVNITDIHAEHALKNYAVYSMAKAAWKMQTRALAKELAPKVRVNAVAPGVVMLPEGINELDEAMLEKLTQSTAVNRIGTPLDISNAVLFLIESNYITGQTLHVDGGRIRLREAEV